MTYTLSKARIINVKEIFTKLYSEVIMSDLQELNQVLLSCKNYEHLFLTSDWIRNLYLRGILTLENVEDLLLDIDKKVFIEDKKNQDLHKKCKRAIIKK